MIHDAFSAGLYAGGKRIIDYYEEEYKWEIIK